MLLGLISGILFAIGFGWTLIRSLTRQLSRLAENLGGNSREVAAAANQVSTASQSLAEGSSEQAASIEETSASLEELSSMTRRNADNSQKANELSRQTRVAADKGVADMQEMNIAMAAIKASSKPARHLISRRRAKSRPRKPAARRFAPAGATRNGTGQAEPAVLATAGVNSIGVPPGR